MSAQHTPGPWTVCEVGRHFIVTRYYPQGGHDTMTPRHQGVPGGRRYSKFRSQDAALEAIHRAWIIEAYEQACNTAPDAREGHLAYYAGKWAVRFNCRESTARAVLGGAA